MRKVKPLDEVGRILSEYNTRYFTLNLETLEFYYSEKQTFKPKNIKRINLIDI